MRFEPVIRLIAICRTSLRLRYISCAPADIIVSIGPKLKSSMLTSLVLGLSAPTSMRAARRQEVLLRIVVITRCFRSPLGPGCAVPKNPAPDPPRCVPKPQSARRLWSTPALDFGECHVIEAARVLSVPVLLSCRFGPEEHRVKFSLAV